MLATGADMRMAKLFVVVGVYVTLTVLVTMANADEIVKTNITVTPDHTVQPTGKDVEFKCISDTGFTVFWVNPNGTRVNDMNNSRFSDNNGTLIITKLEQHDSGEYICYTSKQEFNVMVNVRVYVMPSYFTEGMVILGINAVLIVVFLLCLIHSTVQHKRMAAQQGYTDVHKNQQM